MTHYAMVIDLNTCVGCNACMAACAMENQTPVWKNKWRTYVPDKEIGTNEMVRRRFFPHMCNHCDNPACMTVCPTGATYKRPDGIVMIDPELCMGCRACAMACPYDARYEVTYSDIREGTEFYGELQRTNPSMDKCSFCSHRIDKGMKPACWRGGCCWPCWQASALAWPARQSARWWICAHGQHPTWTSRSCRTMSRAA